MRSRLRLHGSAHVRRQLIKFDIQSRQPVGGSNAGNLFEPGCVETGVKWARSFGRKVLAPNRLDIGDSKLLPPRTNSIDDCFRKTVPTGFPAVREVTETIK